MPLSKQRKNDVVGEVGELLSDSKMTVAATYVGTSVKDLQELRKNARQNGTTLKVVKNRLFKQAISSNDKLKSVDLSALSGQLIYGFNAQDEAAPAQSLAEFAKTHPNMEFVVGITEDAQLLSADDVKALSNLPSKDQLRAQLVGTLSGPARGFVIVLSGNIRGVMNVLNARAEALGE